MTDNLSHEARHLSLEPPLPRLTHRESTQSTFESADQAEGIFDLYGGARDSWQSNGPSHTPAEPVSQHVIGNGQIEEHVEPPKSPASWTGPVAALNDEGAQSRRVSSIAPPITVTAANTPERQRSFADHTRDSTFTSLNSNSPTHPSIRRLSPRQNGTSTNTSASTSQVSIAGSSQYPGEENDAFHVRSTCESRD